MGALATKNLGAIRYPASFYPIFEKGLSQNLDFYPNFEPGLV